MEPNQLADSAAEIADRAAQLAERLDAMGRTAAEGAAEAAAAGGAAHGADFFLVGLTVFVLACFVGYYVVWRVTPALHSPLMSVTNAVSSVIIVGALIAAGPATMNFSSFMGFLAVVLASVNIFGGFIVTRRMLAMYKKKQKK
ncbi:MAG: NAD(P) transhydrogenase subunit alpha part 2 [Alphaproteobacteria bacterium]|jgi:NAD(P) transhydrogenase subunit alpha|nr:NAD(P) transhydrogenase subunit alpha part 2 [Alphaproteobacteria bacterium]